jgi:threonine synthase
MTKWMLGAGPTSMRTGPFGVAPAAELRCNSCHGSLAIGARFEGCPHCAALGRLEPLEVGYDYDRLRMANLLDDWSERQLGLWAFAELLPLGDPDEAVSLAEGGTPLVLLDTPGPGRIWVKDETRNPTGAHKDRFHSVSVSMARQLGLRKVVAATTGNHGLSAAAYSARAGLSCLIFCDPRSPRVIRDLIQFYNARLATVENWEPHLERMVKSLGWYPSTGLTPDPVGTPYGVEGYKTIAYEIFFQLGKAFPSRVISPVAGGDIFYGPWKGFQELALLGAAGGNRLPRMTAAQSAGCDPIVRGFKAHATEVPFHPDPKTIALSIANRTASAIALATAYQSNGGAEAVSDDEIILAVRYLAAQGIAVEPSGAVAVAVALAQQRRRDLVDGENVVCLLTGAAVKWPDTVKLGVASHELQEADNATVDAWISQVDAALEASATEPGAGVNWSANRPGHPPAASLG